MTAERAREKVKGLVMVTSDGSTLLVRQCEAKTVKDIHGPSTVTTAVTPCGLTQIVE